MNFQKMQKSFLVLPRINMKKCKTKDIFCFGRQEGRRYHDFPSVKMQKQGLLTCEVCINYFYTFWNCHIIWSAKICITPPSYLFFKKFVQRHYAINPSFCIILLISFKHPIRFT